MSTPTTHVIAGAGPVGSGLALRLAERGDHVLVVTRSGTAPAHARIEAVRGDVSDQTSFAAICRGAATIVNAVNPPYTDWADVWPGLHASFLAAAESSGARLVMMENLYGYGRPAHPGGVMLDNDPLAPCSVKGTVRARMAEEMFAAHAAGRVRATSVRASDFFGPGVSDAQIGERSMKQLLTGKAIDSFGDVTLPHTVSYMPDVTAALEIACLDDRALGRAWHAPSAPAISTKELYGRLAAALEMPAPRIRALRGMAMSMIGLVMPIVRELKEISYQFTEPWVMDSSEFTRTFGLEATPLATSIPATAMWWRAHLGTASAAA